MEKEVIYKYRVPITIAGKYINSATLGSLGTLLCCRSQIPASVRGLSFKELFLELVRNIFGGHECYSYETEVGQALLVLAQRVQKLIGKKLKGGPAENLPAFLATLIYDASPDYEIEIEL